MKRFSLSLFLPLRLLHVVIGLLLCVSNLSHEYGAHKIVVIIKIDIVLTETSTNKLIYLNDTSNVCVCNEQRIRDNYFLILFTKFY